MTLDLRRIARDYASYASIQYNIVGCDHLYATQKKHVIAVELAQSFLRSHAVQKKIGDATVMAVDDSSQTVTYTTSLCLLTVDELEKLLTKVSATKPQP